jgi:hypothetical protein
MLNSLFTNILTPIAIIGNVFETFTQGNVLSGLLACTVAFLVIIYWIIRIQSTISTQH